MTSKKTYTGSLTETLVSLIDILKKQSTDELLKTDHKLWLELYRKLGEKVNRAKIEY